MFAVHLDLAGAPGVLHLASPAIGRGFGDFLVRGVTEGLAFVFDAPHAVVAADRKK